MRISDWSSDVCSSDLLLAAQAHLHRAAEPDEARQEESAAERWHDAKANPAFLEHRIVGGDAEVAGEREFASHRHRRPLDQRKRRLGAAIDGAQIGRAAWREEEGQYG